MSFKNGPVNGFSPEQVLEKIEESIGIFKKYNNEYAIIIYDEINNHRLFTFETKKSQNKNLCCAKNTTIKMLFENAKSSRDIPTNNPGSIVANNLLITVSGASPEINEAIAVSIAIKLRLISTDSAVKIMEEYENIEIGMLEEIIAETMKM